MSRHTVVEYHNNEEWLPVNVKHYNYSLYIWQIDYNYSFMHWILYVNYILVDLHIKHIIMYTIVVYYGTIDLFVVEGGGIKFTVLEFWRI